MPSKAHGHIDQDPNKNDSLVGADSALGASYLDKLADDEQGIKRNDSSILKFNESINQPMISKSLNTSYLRNAIAKARKAELGLKVNRQGSDTVKNGKIKKQIINIGFLTSVPKRGKMIDTQKYIR